MSEKTNDAVVGTNPPFKRAAYTTANAKGESVAQWTLTPVVVDDWVQIVAQPMESVPIIFVPGIMGSNLMVTNAVNKLDAKAPVWLMDGAVAAAKMWALRSPETRQLRLDPKNTEVTNDGKVPDNVPTIGDAKMIREQRFWGEVGAMSYQSYLVWLEQALNGKGRVDGWRALQGSPGFAAAVSKGFTFDPLQKADVDHAADMRFPVYACGYNWLQSNEKSAQRLGKRIDEVIKANNSKSFNCQRVILITHSMGGLVARACSELQGYQGKIAGIVHGVMPATGAAVAYKRVRSGTEGSAGVVIGPDAATVTAVFANAPGALQLLPSQHYPSGWLKLGVESGAAFKQKVALPVADPYEEIYTKKGVWWGLVDEKLINPAKLAKHEGWDSYLKNINEAKDFHATLGSKYHPNTIAFYGDGTDGANGKTWGTVRWEAVAANDMTTVTRGRTGHATVAMDAKPEELLAMLLASDDGEGKVSAQHGARYRYDFVLSSKDSAGDGTVPVASGAGPAQAGKAAGVQASYHLNVDAEGHEGAYRVPLAQQLSVHVVLTVARKITVTAQ